MTTPSLLVTSPRPHTQIVRWPGASGRWYAHTVFAWDALPEVEGANFILVATDRQGAWEPLFIGRSESLARDLVTLPEWSAAQTLGLTQIHVHLLGADGHERELIRADLAACVSTPLNVAPEDAGQSGAQDGMWRVGGVKPVRWLGGRQPFPRAMELGLEYILPQAAAVQRAG